MNTFKRAILQSDEDTRDLSDQGTVTNRKTLRENLKEQSLRLGTLKTFNQSGEET